MKAKGKSMVWVLVVLGLAFPLFVGAAGQSGDAATAEKPMEITWMYRFDDSWLIHYLNDKFNVVIKSNGIYRNDAEKADLMLASGEAPEVFVGWDGIELWEDGITRSIPEAWVRQYAPESAKAFDDNGMAWLVEKNPDKEGEYIGLTGIAENVDGPVWWPAFRSDYVENVGIELPDYESKKELVDKYGRIHFYEESFPVQWFEDLLVAFRDGDPDGNGKIDTIPLAGCNHGANAWGSLYGAFGLTYSVGDVNTKGTSNYEENGQTKPEVISERTREFLKLLARWYSMNLIDKEFPVLTNVNMWPKIQTGVLGMQLGANMSYAGANDRSPNNWCTEEEIAQGVEVVVPMPPVGANGMQGVQNYATTGTLNQGSSLRIRKDVSDEKLKKILEIYDYLYYDTEGWIYRFYGKPGVHFEWSGTPWESPGIRKEVADIPAEYNQSDSNWLQMALKPYAYVKATTVRFIYPAELWPWWNKAVFGSLGQELSIFYHRWDVFESTDLRDIYDTYGEGLNTMWSEFYLKAITGEVDLDDDFDEFVARWKKNGGDELTVELNKAPLISALRQGKIEY